MTTIYPAPSWHTSDCAGCPFCREEYAIVIRDDFRRLSSEIQIGWFRVYGDLFSRDQKERSMRAAWHSVSEPERLLLSREDWETFFKASERASFEVSQPARAARAAEMSIPMEFIECVVDQNAMVRAMRAGTPYDPRPAAYTPPPQYPRIAAAPVAQVDDPPDQNDVVRQMRARGY